MSDINIQGCLRVFDIIVHLNFLLVGLYFIYHGEIFPRFLKGRTQFAEFEEDIKELPTVLAYIEFKKTPITPLNYGFDFNISFRVVGQGKPQNLTQGDNTIHWSQLKLRLEEQTEFSTNLKQPAEKRQVPEQKTFLLTLQCQIVATGHVLACYLYHSDAEVSCDGNQSF